MRATRWSNCIFNLVNSKELQFSKVNLPISKMKIGNLMNFNHFNVVHVRNYKIQWRGNNMSCSDEVCMNLWWVSGPFFVIISCNAIFVCLIEVNEKMSLVLFILKTIENSFKYTLSSKFKYYMIEICHWYHLTS